MKLELIISPPFNPWRLYEIRKREWIETHPGAQPAEYEVAMRRIADETIPFEKARG